MNRHFFIHGEDLGGTQTFCWYRYFWNPRAPQRYQSVPKSDDSVLTHAVVELANLYGRYGY